MTVSAASAVLPEILAKRQRYPSGSLNLLVQGRFRAGSEPVLNRCRASTVPFVFERLDMAGKTAVN
jgi:predicted transcriptional regulator